MPMAATGAGVLASDGWMAVQRTAGGRRSTGPAKAATGACLTLRGDLPLARMESTPVSQVSYFEADAYARWAGRRLPHGV